MGSGEGLLTGGSLAWITASIVTKYPSAHFLLKDSTRGMKNWTLLMYSSIGLVFSIFPINVCAHARFIEGNIASVSSSS